MVDKFTFPVLSLIKSYDWMTTLKTTEFLTSKLRSSNDGIYPELRLALKERGVEPKEVCLVWVTPLNERNDKLIVLVSRCLEVFCFDWQKSQIKDWKSLTSKNEPESHQEYTHAGKEFFDKHDT